MEPRIQYAKTADGVSIAFWTLGEGKPFVYMPMPPPWSHAQMEWQNPNWRGFYETLANKRKLVRYDNRGSGMSTRDTGDYSLDAHLLDLEAVTDRLDLQSFSLYGYSHAVPIAIAYAARHPERISRLVIHSGYAGASDYRSLPRIQAFEALLDGDWEIFTEAAAQIYYGWGTGEPARWLAQWMRECVTHEVAKAAFQEFQRFDVAPLLPHVVAPTLVLHQRQDPWSSAEISRELASTIPDARLVVLEGPIHETEGMLTAIDEFLDEGEQAAQAPAPDAGAFRTILFTDIEGSTALTQRLGDAGAREVLREHERITREALAAHGGSEVKTMGDGFMASFGSATKALECAITVQRAFDERNRGVGAQHTPRTDEPGNATGAAPLQGIRVRIGLTAGEPIAEDDPGGRGDLFGTAVIRAARIAAMAQGGEILVTNVVRELAEGKGFMFGDRGEAVLRGFDDPVRVFEVRWREDA